MGDFCELIGENPEEAIKKLGTSVAARRRAALTRSA